MKELFQKEKSLSQIQSRPQIRKKFKEIRQENLPTVYPVGRLF